MDKYNNGYNIKISSEIRNITGEEVTFVELENYISSTS